MVEYKLVDSVKSFCEFTPEQYLGRAVIPQSMRPYAQRKYEIDDDKYAELLEVTWRKVISEKISELQRTKLAMPSCPVHSGKGVQMDLVVERSHNYGRNLYLVCPGEALWVVIDLRGKSLTKEDLEYAYKQIILGSFAIPEHLLTDKPLKVTHCKLPLYTMAGCSIEDLKAPTRDDSRLLKDYCAMDAAAVTGAASRLYEEFRANLKRDTRKIPGYLNAWDIAEDDRRTQEDRFMAEQILQSMK
jgi:hypothetical protein